MDYLLYIYFRTGNKYSYCRLLSTNMRYEKDLNSKQFLQSYKFYAKIMRHVLKINLSWFLKLLFAFEVSNLWIEPKLLRFYYIIYKWFNVSFLKNTNILNNMTTTTTNNGQNLTEDFLSSMLRNLLSIKGKDNKYSADNI